MQIAPCETHIVHLEPDDTVLSFGQRDISESTSAPVSLKSLPRVASDWAVGGAHQDDDNEANAYTLHAQIPRIGGTVTKNTNLY